MSGGNQTRDTKMCVVREDFFMAERAQSWRDAPESASTGIGRGQCKPYCSRLIIV
jgi:hypothetical protein